jgi:hypothetical protein
MGKILMVSLVLLFVGVATIFALYHFKEKPKLEPPVIEFHNVSIKFVDNATKKEIAMPFVVVSDETSSVLTKGNYIGQDYGLTSFISNQSFSIFNTQGKDCVYTPMARIAYIPPDGNSRALRKGQSFGGKFLWINVGFSRSRTMAILCLEMTSSLISRVRVSSGMSAFA